MPSPSIEKARLVSKLRHARERVRQEKGKCEGRKPHGELRPEAVALAKRLHRASPKTGKRMSLRKIAAALAEAGHLNERGQPLNPKSIPLGHGGTKRLISTTENFGRNWRARNSCGHPLLLRRQANCGLINNPVP